MTPRRGSAWAGLAGRRIGRPGGGPGSRAGPWPSPSLSLRWSSDRQRIRTIPRRPGHPSTGPVRQACASRNGWPCASIRASTSPATPKTTATSTSTTWCRSHASGTLYEAFAQIPGHGTTITTLRHESILRKEDCLRTTRYRSADGRHPARCLRSVSAMEHIHADEEDVVDASTGKAGTRRCWAAWPASRAPHS
jgi:hypothetical protein